MRFVEARLMDPSGVGYTVLPAASSLSFDDKYLEVGFLDMTYPLDLAVSLGLTDQVEISIAPDGVERTRYCIESTSESATQDGARYRTLQGRSMLARLDDAIVYPMNWTPEMPNGGVDPITGVSAPTGHSFLNATPGTIMRALVGKAVGRGALLDLDVNSFGQNTTSNGVGWAKIQTINFGSGQTYLQVLMDMMTRGLCDAVMEGKALKMYNSGYLGTHVSTSSVVIRRGANIVEQSTATNSRDVADATLMEGEGGIVVENSDAVAQGVIGRRRERYASQGGINDVGTLDLLGQAELDGYKTIKLEETTGISHQVGQPQPWVNFKCGQWVAFDKESGIVEVQVRQIAVGVDANGIITCGLTLGDFIDSQDVALARKIDAITGGNSSTYGPLPNTGIDLLGPSAPAACNVTSGAYTDGYTGHTYAQATISWPEVYTNTDGTVITDLAGYHAEYRVNGSAAITFVERAGSLVSITAPGHAFATGQSVTISTGDGVVDGLHTVTSVSTTGFQYVTDTSGTISEALGGTAESAWVPLNATTTTAVYTSGLPLGGEFEARVQAVDTSSGGPANASDWTYSGVVILATDVVAPPVPSAPVVSVFLGAVRIRWDGAFVLSQSRPTDFKHVEAHMSLVQGFVPDSTTLVGAIVGENGGGVAVNGSIGSTYFCALVSVDTSNNRSAGSEQTQADPAQAIRDDLSESVIADVTSDPVLVNYFGVDSQLSGWEQIDGVGTTFWSEDVTAPTVPGVLALLDTAYDEWKGSVPRIYSRSALYKMRITAKANPAWLADPDSRLYAGFTMYGVDRETTVDIYGASGKPSTSRTNLCPNPSGEVDAQGWQALWAQPDTIAAGSSFNATTSGTRGFRVTFGDNVPRGFSMMIAVPTTPGLPYTISADVFVPEGMPDVYMAGYFLGEGEPTAVKDRVVRISARFFATGANAWVGFGSEQATSAGQYFDFDSVLVEVGGEVRDYFDGSFSNAQWVGTPHNSASLEPPGVQHSCINGVRPELATGEPIKVNTASWSGSVATLNTAKTHRYSEGQAIKVSGVGVPYDGTWVTDSGTTGTVIKFPCGTSGSPASPSSATVAKILGSEYVEFIAYVSGVSPTQAGNLIHDPDFETGDYVTGSGGVVGYGFTAPPSAARTTARSYAGTYSLRTSWTTLGAFQAMQTHVFPVETGTTYQIDGWVYVPTGSPDLIFREFNGVANTRVTITDKDVWTYVSLNWTSTFTGTAYWGFAGVQQPVNGQYFDLDDRGAKALIGAAQLPGVDADHPENSYLSTWERPLSVNAAGKYWRPHIYSVNPLGGGLLSIDSIEIYRQETDMAVPNTITAKGANIVGPLQAETAVFGDLVLPPIGAQVIKQGMVWTATDTQGGGFWQPGASLVVAPSVPPAPLDTGGLWLDSTVPYAQPQSVMWYNDGAAQAITPSTSTYSAFSAWSIPRFIAPSAGLIAFVGTMAIVNNPTPSGFEAIWYINVTSPDGLTITGLTSTYGYSRPSSGNNTRGSVSVHGAFGINRAGAVDLKPMARLNSSSNSGTVTASFFTLSLLFTPYGDTTSVIAI